MSSKKALRLLALVSSFTAVPRLLEADGWRATDSAAEGGWSSKAFPGQDDPPHGNIWFAPDAARHNQWWYDYDNNTGSTPGDWVVDSNMRWSLSSINEFLADPDWNLVHEVRVSNLLYEADSYYSSNLPDITLNEDSIELEESWDGYEEKEVGTLTPEFLSPSTDYYVWTYWRPLLGNRGTFASETELTRHTTGCLFFCDDWTPADFRELGTMDFTTTPSRDLVVTSLNVPSRGTPGGSIDVSVNVVNQRNAETTAFRVGYYYSTDTTIAKTDIFSGWYCNLAATNTGGTSWGCSGKIGVPASLTPGSYYLGAIADDLNAIGESDENNNTRAVPIVVGVNPPGPFTLTASAGCASGAPFITLSWISSNGVVSHDLYRNGSLWRSGLAANIRGYGDATAQAGQQYSYYVRAINSGGFTNSNTVGVNARTDCAVSTPPTIGWEFNSNGNTEGWRASNMAAVAVTGGRLFLDPAGLDPYISSPTITVDASKYKNVRLNMASNLLDGNGVMYFKTQVENFYSESKRVNFTVNKCSLCGSAAWYNYTVYVGGHAKWAGTITGIRLDPGDKGQGGTNKDSVGIDFLRLTP